jgi:hypothetical protein
MKRGKISPSKNFYSKKAMAIKEFYTAKAAEKPNSPIKKRNSSPKK